MVLGQIMEEHDSTRELAEDLLAVCNYFVAKNNGMRSAENKRKRKLEEREREGKEKDEKNRNKSKETRKNTSRKSKKDKVISDDDTEDNSLQMVWNDEVDIQ